MPCNYLTGCNDFQKAMVGDAWQYKKVVGTTVFGTWTGNSFLFYPPWPPAVWSAGCITASKSTGETLTELKLKHIKHSRTFFKKLFTIQVFKYFLLLNYFGVQNVISVRVSYRPAERQHQRSDCEQDRELPGILPGHRHQHPPDECS